ncbi:MAG: SRPBCC domain-containing protein [Planctomycetes bacterium]|nr:SRPBCC domain-containing protein [Planctomycetota bacterium]
MRPTYLFLLSPPFSGSTLLYRLIGTSANVSTLFGHGNWAGEGQALPGAARWMRASKGPDPRVGGFWDPALQMPWAEIKTVWDRHWDLTKPILAEKSPPNMCRAESILEFFSRHGDVVFVGLMRSPYAVKQSAQHWLEQARFQRHNAHTLPRFLQLTYEELCSDPAGVAARIEAHVPGIGALDPELRSTAGAVAGERGEGLEDKTALTRSLVEHRTRVLEPHAELVRSFGYELLHEGSPAWSALAFQPEVEVRRHVDAPPSVVFAAWTQLAHLRRWWSTAELPGSRLHWTAAGPPPLALHGERLESVPGRSLSFAREVSREHIVLDDTLVKVELEAAGAGTDVLVRELRVPRARIEETRAFWTERLEALAERGCARG